MAIVGQRYQAFYMGGIQAHERHRSKNWDDFLPPGNVNAQGPVENLITIGVLSRTRCCRATLGSGRVMPQNAVSTAAGRSTLCSVQNVTRTLHGISEIVSFCGPCVRRSCCLRNIVLGAPVTSESCNDLSMPTVRRAPLHLCVILCSILLLLPDRLGGLQ